MSKICRSRILKTVKLSMIRRLLLKLTKINQSSDIKLS